jgi:C_GCAxxG_C_C family probable redox protein
MKHKTNQDVLERLENKAKENLAICGNCAQTAFLTLMDEFQMDADEILKALTPFPGIALRGETCGAVTGSLMALGLEFGRDRKNLDDWQAYIDSLRPSRKFCHLFESELGSTMCSEIVADKFGMRFDLADPVEAMHWFSCGAHDKCGQVISKGVCIAAKIILESREIPGSNAIS